MLALRLLLVQRCLRLRSRANMVSEPRLLDIGLRATYEPNRDLGVARYLSRNRLCYHNSLGKLLAELGGRYYILIIEC